MVELHIIQYNEFSSVLRFQFHRLKKLLLLFTVKIFKKNIIPVYYILYGKYRYNIYYNYYYNFNKIIIM